METEGKQEREREKDMRRDVVREPELSHYLSVPSLLF
jgi:hypothetical protein